MSNLQSVIASYTNNLNTYLGDWTHILRMTDNAVSKAHKPLTSCIPIQSFATHEFDVCVSLGYLDDKLTVLESEDLDKAIGPPLQLDTLSLSDATFFLKTTYLHFRILLDDIAGIIQLLYKQHEPLVKIPNSFEDLLKRESVPEEVKQVVQVASGSFSSMRKRRNDLEHYYESFLVTLQSTESGVNDLKHFGIKGKKAAIMGRFANTSVSC